MQNIDRRQALGYIATGAAITTGLISQTAQAQMQFPMMPFGGNRSGAEFPAVGQTVKLVDVPLLNGKTFTASQAKDQILVIYWWASWCPFCAVQSPLMEKLWQANRSKGLQMLTFSTDSRKEAAVGYLQKKGFTFPAAFMTTEMETKYPKPRGLPSTAIIGRDGKVIKIESGMMNEFDVEDIAKLI